MSDVPEHLSRLLEKEEAWLVLGDFDALMKASDERLESVASATDAVEVAKLLHGFARDHYYLYLVGQFKLKEIARGVRSALDIKNETVLFNLARAMVEHTAALAYQLSDLEKSVGELPKRPVLASLQKEIERHHRVVKKLYYNQKAEIHVHDMIKALSKYDASARSGYDQLCEFVHPNHGSYRAVSSGQLGAGQIRANPEQIVSETVKAVEFVERCAHLSLDEFMRRFTLYLTSIAGWVEIACQPGAKLSQVFSIRESTSGDGKTKESALYFAKARTHQEATQAFYAYLRSHKLALITRRLATVEGGFLYDVVLTDKHPLWVKYRMDE